MKLDGNYFIFLTQWPGLDEGDIDADLDSKFNAEQIEFVENEISTVWDKKKAANSRLYAQTKFRLGKLSDEFDEIDFYAEQTASNRKPLTLGIGLTDYRQFVGTNLNPNVIKFAQEHENRRILSDLIGVNGVLITADGFILIVRRADWVGEHPGMLDTPGGHPEPSNVDDLFNMKNHSKIPDISSLSSRDVVHELFKSQQEEISVEFNIPMERVSFPKLLSIGRVSSGNGRPVMYFQLSTTLTKDEIEQNWQKGGQETDEASALVFVHESDLATLPDTEMWQEISPNGHLSLISLIESKNLEEEKKEDEKKNL